MNEKEILSVSLNSLLKIYPPTADDLCYDGCVLGHRETLDDEIAMDLFRFPTRINSFGALLCSKGSLTITSDLQRHTIGPRTLFLCPPQTIVQVLSHDDNASVHFILCEEEFLNRVQIDLKQVLHLFMAVRENPCLELDDTEWNEVMRSLEEVFAEGRRNCRDAFSTEILHSLFRTLAYRVYRIIDNRISRHSEEHADDTPSRNRNKAYFSAFMEELLKHYMQERSVGFYAERLHLTPKYLTTLLRTTTGRTASEWIDAYVILEAKNLLKYSSMNIQEIAYYLNFPNQSFFGRYFKEHTGMTPSAYRSIK